ncbi:ABC transporter permease subunit [Actinomadura harenae]|uniref:ABC transporter permease n=1 Tax=Actinomadura harenae TaxID=2483351 RepID=A0A3M2MEN0_9ACTN|nr:ABC transporter permease subunit [Actinomadura harenae]RMI47470.1 ABC transporter permease [Actinomadura harenae]
MPEPVTRGMLASEWIKLRSVRSTWLTLLCALLFVLAFGLFDTLSVTESWNTMSIEDKASFDPLAETFAGMQIGELAFGVLGVLAVSVEYETGTIRTALSAVPRRGRVFAAKAIVAGGVMLAAGLVLAVVTFLGGQWMLSAKHLAPRPTDPGVLRSVACTGLYLAVVGLIGYGLGALIRHTAAAISVMFAVIWLTYAATHAVEKWTYTPDRWLLVSAYQTLSRTHPQSGPSALRAPTTTMALIELATYLLVFLSLGAHRMSQDP